jgi:hypothetical protein
MLLQDLIDPEHLRRFRQALYNLEEFDIQGLSWEIDLLGHYKKQGRR